MERDKSTAIASSEAEFRATATKMVDRLRVGDPNALADLFQLYHDRLYRLISIRLDRKLLARIDPSDLLQDAYIDASERIDHFLSREGSSIAVWLRLIVMQRIQLAVRHHLLTGKRDARRETPIFIESGSRVVCGLTDLLADSITSPSASIARREAVAGVVRLLQEMPKKDREVLILRHFEQIPNEEVAEVLDICVKAASNRYVRALARLQTLVEELERRSASIKMAASPP